MSIKLNLLFALFTFSFLAMSQPFPRPPFCDPAESWKTVDIVKSIEGSALLAGVASYKNFAFAVGSANLGGRTTGNWVIRRSLDFGDTWSTANVLTGGGRGIAVDPRNGHLYSIGSVYHADTDDHHNWIVQKSTDNGSTWTVLEDFYSENHFYSTERVVVDGNGHIIVIGADSVHGEGTKPFMRRSENGGLNWTTVSYAPSNFFGSQIAASRDGQVVVVGKQPTSDPETVGAKWVVLHSPNGKTFWKQVDLVLGSPSDPAVSAFANGVSINKFGKVVVVGGAGKGFEGRSRMIVRESSLTSITNWKTVVNYQPYYRRLGFGSASGNHIVLMNNLRFIVTGRQRRPGSFIDTNIALDKRSAPMVRLIDFEMNPFTSPFQHESVYAGGLTNLPNGLALAGHILDEENEKSWYIRKMTCAF